MSLLDNTADTKQQIKDGHKVQPVGIVYVHQSK